MAQAVHLVLEMLGRIVLQKAILEEEEQLVLLHMEEVLEAEREQLVERPPIQYLEMVGLVSLIPFLVLLFITQEVAEAVEKVQQRLVMGVTEEAEMEDITIQQQ